jgi:hypothetical protein
MEEQNKKFPKLSAAPGSRERRVAVEANRSRALSSMLHIRRIRGGLVVFGPLQSSTNQGPFVGNG